MKTTIIKFVLAIFLLSACTEDDGVLDHLSKKGKFTISTQEAPKKLIELTNARTATRDDGITGVTIEIILTQDGKEVLRQPWEPGDVVEVEYGKYELILRSTIVGGIYDGLTSFQGDELFSIDEQTPSPLQLDMWVIRYAHDIQVHLENLPEAKIWVGPVGFQPEEKFKYVEWGTEVYGDAFDVVVEYDGKQKRYTTEATPGSVYIITIKREEEEPAPKGSFTIEYQLSDRAPVYVDYTW